MALTTNLHIAPRLKKEWSYTSTPPLGLRSLLEGDLYLYTIDAVKENVETKVKFLSWQLYRSGE